MNIIICDYLDCDQPISEEDHHLPDGAKRYCEVHGYEFAQYVKNEDVRQIMRMFAHSQRNKRHCETTSPNSECLYLKHFDGCKDCKDAFTASNSNYTVTPAADEASAENPGAGE